MDKELFTDEKLKGIKNENAQEKPDNITKDEKKDLERNRKEMLENNNLDQDIKLKNFLARAVTWMVVGWLVAVFVILIIQACYHHGFSDSVLITLLSTTTLNILSMLYIIARYLFPNTGRQHKLPVQR